MGLRSAHRARLDNDKS
jgi:hypothetical protein